MENLKDSSFFYICVPGVYLTVENLKTSSFFFYICVPGIYLLF